MTNALEIENKLSLSARSACLMDAESGKILFGKNENSRMPMASTTKIMTAILAIESGIPLDTNVKIPRQAVGIEGSSIYLEEGESITLEALLYGLLLCSANDASVAIALVISGSVEAFVDKMNAKACELGLVNTHFTNPHGLYDKSHYTTARELGILMSYCSKNEQFLKISGTQKRVFPRGEDSSRVMINHNKLLTNGSNVIAGKTGFTKKSGRCLVTLAERDDMKLVCVTLDAPNDWNDHKKLYDFGYKSYKIVKFESILLEIPVISGKKHSIYAKSNDVSLLLPKDAEIQTKINAPRFLFAPVKIGEKIGEAVYFYQGREIMRSPLLVCNEVDRENYRFNIFFWLSELLKRIFS